VTTGENTHGFRGAFSPCSALGRPPGNRNVARVQNQRVPEDEQAFTGLLSVTTAGTWYKGPAAQSPDRAHPGPALPGPAPFSDARRAWPLRARLTPMATIVAFHAHPDDEVLLTGGTIARLAAEGHRVIIVVATDGEVWPGPAPGRRLEELRASAAILGADQAVHLGYADSGHGPVLYPDPPGQVRFARADPDEAAGKLAALLREEGADLLLSYNPQGQYGHRDHVMVHRVGARAAALAGPVRVLEGTAPRETVALLFGLVAGREWFAEPGAESARPIGDVLQPAPRAEGTVRR
jgi:LmbE family N-acetylglucosaminyl deacetylase